MNDPTDRAVSHPRARLTGIVWLAYFALGILGSLLTKGIVVRGDAVATSTNLVAHATLFQIGSALDLFANCIYVALAVLLYGLFRRVDRDLALLRSRSAWSDALRRSSADFCESLRSFC